MGVTVLTCTKRDGSECAYIGTVGSDGWVYFNDQYFYRFKNIDTWEENVYVLNQSRHSWTKADIFTKINGILLSSGAGSTSANSSVEKAVQWMQAIAKDNSHGYDQSNRWGPDYDCSSLVYEAFRVGGGFSLPVHSGYTGSMISDFTKVGFKWLSGVGNKSSECQRGDILLDIDSHVEVYLGNEMNVGAHINEFGGITGGQTGDQSGREICESGYYSHPWDGILRYSG